MKYKFAEIEKKWQKFWEENRIFEARDDFSLPKYYVLDMFPYPSSDGLHVGHPEGYTATDIMARYKRMKGYNVLHPMGWDAFGLPAEQYAIKTKTHPRVITQRSIENFKRQLKAIGFSYDWSREINTTDPKYYKWTQWIFLQLYKKGLAYQAEVPVNWCPELGTVLANEEVPEQIEKGYTVIRKPMKQWMLKITEYADRLLSDLDMLDWPESTKEMQRNWIGKSEGAKVIFRLKNSGKTLEVFTTRPDTLWGVTYMVIAPEHPLVHEITTAENLTAVNIYRENSKTKSDLERHALDKNKTGVFTGAFAVNPVNNSEIPVWISDYVLMTYGTGAVMAVPAHDQRDWEFAKKYHLNIKEVVRPLKGKCDISTEGAYEGEGICVDSGFITNLKTEDARIKVIKWLEEKGLGSKATHYKLRDWLFSRQRFWGEPFPLIYLEDGTVKPVPEDELPVMLPDVESYEPTGSGESPLARFTDWVNTIDKQTGKPARRETNTMPQWAGSCWYYLRYIDPHNEREFVSKEKEKYWMPVDLYIGGTEQSVLHLLYARFWHKVLYDLGLVSTPEPFMRLYHQGMILGEDNNKMSKSRGNVINPDDVIARYGADSLRLFEMFLGPLSATKPWSTKGIEGVHRFLNRLWRLVIDEEGKISSRIKDIKPEGDAEILMHVTIRNITRDIEDMDMKFNTCVSEFMKYVNELYKMETIPLEMINVLIKLISPFAPHIAEELWQRLGNNNLLAYEKWPEYDTSKTDKKTVTIVVQINGKVRTRISAESDTEESELLKLVKKDRKVMSYINGKDIVKEIVVKNRLVNLVVK